MDFVAPDEVFVGGLHLIGFDDNCQAVRRKWNLWRFSSHFGAKPNVHAVIWTNLQMTTTTTTTTTNEAAVDIQAESAQPVDLLVAAHFLKCHPKDNNTEGTFRTEPCVADCGHGHQKFASFKRGKDCLARTLEPC